MVIVKNGPSGRGVDTVQLGSVVAEEVHRRHMVGRGWRATRHRRDGTLILLNVFASRVVPVF